MFPMPPEEPYLIYETQNTVRYVDGRPPTPPTPDLIDQDDATFSDHS